MDWFMHHPVLLGLVGAGVAVGYGLYLRSVLRQKIDPKRTSALRFGYGTSLIVGVERAAGASWRGLILPIVCAAASVAVAGSCWSRGTLR